MLLSEKTCPASILHHPMSDRVAEAMETNRITELGSKNFRNLIFNLRAEKMKFLRITRRSGRAGLGSVCEKINSDIEKCFQRDAGKKRPETV